MKLTIEQHMAAFKKQYGEGDATMDSRGRLTLPKWLEKMAFHLSGIRSKKRRIIKKTVTRKINEMLEKAANGS